MNRINRIFKKAHRAISERNDHKLLEEKFFASGLGDSAWVLYALAKSLKPDVCVEIGAARGKSACYVGMALKENGKGKIYSIDPHEKTEWNDSISVDTYDVIQQNIQDCQVEPFVEIVRSYSDKAGSTWDKSIDIIFIDGDHSYDGVKRDWELFLPHMSEFGVVIFHDTFWDIRPQDPKYARDDMGVPRFVEELRQKGYPLITLDKDCGVTLVQTKPGGVPLSDLSRYEQAVPA
jgi:predicted O-methyltransferase YrrM